MERFCLSALVGIASHKRMLGTRDFIVFRRLFAWILVFALACLPPVKVVVHVAGPVSTAEIVSSAESHHRHGHHQHHHDADDAEKNTPTHELGDHSHDFGVRLALTLHGPRFTSQDWTQLLPATLRASPIFLLERPPRA